MFNKKEYKKQWYIDNRERILDIYKINREKILKRNKQWWEKNHEKYLEYQGQYRKDNRERIKKDAKKHNDEMREYIQNYKMYKGCKICDYNKCAAALDFHHPNNDKKISIGSICDRCLKTIKKEIEKCEVLCCRCHKELHEKEKNNN